MTTFALAAIDEILVRGKLVERRLTHGRAEQHGNEIVADDSRDETLLRRCTAAMERLREAAPNADRIHLVSRASTEGDEASMTVTIAGATIVTDADHVKSDVEKLRAQKPSALSTQHSALLWLNGTASVLLHEAFGHPNEHDVAPVAWPQWLRIHAPLAVRRESFRDVPLRRLTTVVAAQTNAPFDLPKEHVAIHYVAGGAYDPVTDVVTIEVAVPRFTLRATRAQVARSIAGARGEPIRYPGVVCSREGQRLVVGSFAPEIITT